MEYIVYITLHIRLNMFVILHHITLHYIILQYASDLGCRRGEPMFHGSVSGSVIGSVIGISLYLKTAIGHFGWG